MHRPLVWPIAAFAAGILLAERVTNAAAALSIAAALLAGMILALRGASPVDERRDPAARLLRRRIVPVLCAAMLAAGFLLHSFQAGLLAPRYAGLFAGTGEGRAVMVGRVLGRPGLSNGMLRLLVLPQSLSVDGKTVVKPFPGFCPVLVSFAFEGASDDPALPKRGDVVRLTGLAALPESARNPGGFDRRQWLASKGAGLSVQADSIPVKVGRQPDLLAAAGDAVHEHVRRTLFVHLPPEEAATLFGMLLGDTDDLAEERKEDFRLSGLMHVMAVSGANIAFLVAPLVWLTSRTPVGRRMAGLVVLPVLLLFVLATGMEPSVVRAAWMAFFLLVGTMDGRRADLACILTATALVLLVGNTFLLFDAGFQMSFLAVAGLAFLGAPVERWMPRLLPAPIRTAAASCLAVQAALLPIFVQVFHRTAPWTLAANLLALPLTGLLTLLGLLVAATSFLPPVAALFGLAADWTCRFLLWVAQSTASLPGSEDWTASVPTPAVWMYGALLLWIAGGRMLDGFPGRRLPRQMIACALALLTAFAAVLPDRQMTVAFLDVGQGDAAVVLFPGGRTMMVDVGGNAKAGRADTVADRIVVPALLSLGIGRPDDILLTHGHADHAGAFGGVIEALGAGRVLLPAGEGALAEEPESIAVEAGIPVTRLRAGDEPVSFREGSLRVLAPTGAGVAGADPNGRSVVLELVLGRFRLLLTGDAGADVEAELLRTGACRDVDVLKVGHHGSASASTEAFLKAVRPEWSIIGAGRNQYGLPSGEALERLRDAGSRILVTRTDGAVIVRTNGEKLEVRRMAGNETPWMQRIVAEMLALEALPQMGMEEQP